MHKNPRGMSNNDSPAAEAIRLIADALTRGGLPRLAGALILLLLASMLIRIPFGLLKAGIDDPGSREERPVTRRQSLISAVVYSPVWF